MDKDQEKLIPHIGINSLRLPKNLLWSFVQYITGLLRGSLSIAGFLFFFIAQTISGDCANMNDMVKNTNNDNALEKMISRIEEGGSFGGSEIMQFQDDPSIIPGLIESLKERPVEYRRASINILVGLGSPKFLPAGLDVKWPAPYVNNLQVANQLVSMLEDTDEEIRNKACEALVKVVPDFIVRNYTNQILNNIEKYPDTDSAALLLGKTGAEAAARQIRSNPKIQDPNPEEAGMGLARLGDREAEEKFIQKYKDAARPSQLVEAADQLGYLATLKATLTLARDIRNPGVYIWLVNSNRSVRVHIIEALSRIFPMEEIFFKPVFKPEDDTYYENIEKWITQNLGVSWEQPRPGFLYEEDAPVIP